MWVPEAIAPSVPGFVSTLRGLVDGATVLTVDGEPVALEPGGAFSVYIAQGATAVELVASSDTGDSTTVSVAVTATPPESTYPATRRRHRLPPLEPASTYHLDALPPLS